MGYQALLFCPDEKTARTVTHVLNDLDFTVEPCTEPFAAVKKLMAQHFDAVVVDCDNEQNATLLFKSARNSNANQSSLAVAVVEGQAGVAKAFRIGANLVLTKPINVEQAKGTLRVARGLLRKGAEAKAAPAAANPATPNTSNRAARSTVAPAVPSAPASAAPARPAPPAGPSFAASAPKPKPAATPAPRPQQPVVAAPTMAARATQVEDREPDSILETDDAEILEAPAPPAKPAGTHSTPAAGTSKFPWQPTAKPLAEPMASALQRAAEAAAKAETRHETTRDESGDHAPTMHTGFASAEDRLAASSGMSSAAAPAPAKEKAQPAAFASAPAPSISRPAFHEAPAAPPAQPERVHAERERPASAPAAPAASTTTVISTIDDAPPPTFFPGHYDTEEEEGSKTKALIIVAAVILLACSAAFLSWKNMSGKSSSQAPATQSAPAPASSAPTSNVGKTPAPAATEPEPEVSQITLGGSSGTASAAAAKPSAIKSAPKETAAPASTAPAEPEVTQRLIVKSDNRHLAKTTPSTQDQEAVQEPTVALNAVPDPKTLASLSKSAPAVPSAAPQVVRVSQGVMEGLILKRVQPRYPAQAMQMRIQGAVQLQATISKTGDITNLKVISGDGILSRSAQEAVKQWKYKPYYLNSEPVEIQTQILVNFKLPN